MFGHRFFGRRYFGPRYFADGGASAVATSYFGHRYFGAHFYGPRYFAGRRLGVSALASEARTLTGQRRTRTLRAAKRVC